ncbi:MAG TPA: right-handed parallel beta-helix repeat-containing protein, partial [Herpetosiphonaceae bacterium]
MLVRSSALRRHPAGLIGAPGSPRSPRSFQHLSTLLVFLVSLILIPSEVRAAQVIDCGGGAYPTRNTALVLRSTDSGSVIRNCVFRDWNAQIGAVIQIDNANDILIENNRFENIRRSDFRDIHAVNIAQYGQRVTIRNNIFVNVGADGVQMGDTAASSGGNIRDITITNNDFSSTNVDIGEEGVDIKRVHGNVVVADNRFHGFRPCEANVQPGCTGSPGAGMVVHAGATGVIIERNRFWDNIYGLTVGAGFANIPPREILVRNNFFYDNQRRALQIDTVHSIKLLNNTIINSGYQHMYVNATPSSTDGWCFNRNNLFAGGTAPASVCTPQNNRYYADPGAVGFVSLTARDLHLQQTSPAVDAGQALTTDVPGDIDRQARPYGSAYDVGADEFASNDQPGCQTATSTSWKNQALPAAQTGSFVVEGELTPPTLGTAGALAVALGQPAAQNWDGLAAIVLFDDVDNRIKARNGASYIDASPPLSYQAATSYHIRMV